MVQRDVSPLERLAPLSYDELRRLARRQMAAESPGHMLQPSALVNEAYLKLMGDTPIEWNDRSQFYTVLARIRVPMEGTAEHRRQLFATPHPGCGLLSRSVF